jgi:hypothetical protein
MIFHQTRLLALASPWTGADKRTSPPSNSLQPIPPHLTYTRLDHLHKARNGCQPACIAWGSRERTGANLFCHNPTSLTPHMFSTSLLPDRGPEYTCCIYVTPNTPYPPLPPLVKDKLSVSLTLFDHTGHGLLGRRVCATHRSSMDDRPQVSHDDGIAVLPRFDVEGGGGGGVV